MSDDEIVLRDGENGGAPAPPSIREYVFLVPRLLKLVWKLARDPRVPTRAKALLFMLGGYLVSPIDLIPDALPGVGQVDDLFLTIFVLDQVLNRVPVEVVKEHWDGDEDLLEVVREVLDVATAFVPPWLKRRLGGA